MAYRDRQDSFQRIVTRLDRRLRSAESGVAGLTPQVFSGLSVTGVTSTATKTILSTKVTTFEGSLIECYVRARGTIGGAGKVLRMKAYVDGVDASQLIAWTGSVTNQVRRTAHGTDVGQLDDYPTSKGGFIVLDDFSGNEVSAGEHTIRFDVYTTDTGLTTNGSVGATIAIRII